MPENRLKDAPPMAIDCRKCLYYYLTWDKRAPHGCRAFGFKGRILPSRTVRQSAAGLDCMFYRKRPPRPQAGRDTISLGPNL